VKSVVDPLTSGEYPAVAGESAVSTIHTVVPGTPHGCRPSELQPDRHVPEPTCAVVGRCRRDR
jgi:hypothetical protein